MSSLRLSPAAQRDLSAVWDYSAERWGVEQAEKYIRELQAAMERIAIDPQRGRAQEQIRGGYRSYAIGSHTLFYIARESSVDVIRILHQRMDATRHL